MGSESNASLAAMMEADASIRSRFREVESLTTWPNKNSVGIPSAKALRLNVTALEKIASWWTAENQSPKVIPIDRLRSEACFVEIPGTQTKIGKPWQTQIILWMC